MYAYGMDYSTILTAYMQSSASHRCHMHASPASKGFMFSQSFERACIGMLLIYDSHLLRPHRGVKASLQVASHMHASSAPKVVMGYMKQVLYCGTQMKPYSHQRSTLSFHTAVTA